MRAERVEGEHAAVRRTGERVAVQVVEVVVLAEGVEGDLPVGGDRVHVGLAEGLPVGEVEHAPTRRRGRAEVVVDVDRRAGPQAADDEAVALRHR